MGSGAKPRPKPILVHFQACRRHKTVFTTKRNTVGTTPRAYTVHHLFNAILRYPVVTFENLVTNSWSVFVCLIFPWNFGGCSNTQNTPLVTALLATVDVDSPSRGGTASHRDTRVITDDHCSPLDAAAAIIQKRANNFTDGLWYYVWVENYVDINSSTQLYFATKW